jgi:hypothetical protein
MINKSDFHIDHGGISLQMLEGQFVVVEIELLLEQAGNIQFFLDSHILDDAVLAFDFQLEIKGFYEIYHSFHHVRLIV